MPTITAMPRRYLKADQFFKETGGLGPYVEDRLSRGDRMIDILRAVNVALDVDEQITAKTLYDWIRRWRAEQPNTEVPA